MACTLCWAITQPRSKQNYLIHLIDEQTGRWGRCVFQSECSHGMQEWAQTLANEAMLYVHDEKDERFLMLHPRVVHVDDQVAAHLPIVDRVDPGGN